MFNEIINGKKLTILFVFTEHPFKLNTFSPFIIMLSDILKLYFIPVCSQSLKLSFIHCSFLQEFGKRCKKLEIIQFYAICFTDEIEGQRYHLWVLLPLECEVKWVLGSITTNKTSGGDGIPVELFQILKDDAVKVLHSICQQTWKTQQWPQEKVSFHSNPKERQCQRMLKLLHNCTHLIR